MKKKRLKPIFKDLLVYFILFILGIAFLLIWVNRVQYFNKNIEKCGSNYCDN